MCLDPEEGQASAGLRFSAAMSVSERALSGTEIGEKSYRKGRMGRLQPEMRSQRALKMQLFQSFVI